jgi:hypothetical protein
LHLKSGAPAIAAGIDLGDVPAKFDIQLFDRHAADVAWDRGAYQFDITPSSGIAAIASMHLSRLRIGL